jgi:hypothetical protein
MPYRFALQDQDYSDLSSGRVLYSLPGAPAFPLRLASEILQRAWCILGLAAPGPTRRLALFDPTCGGAYHLTALGFLHGEWIESITASDINPGTLALAQRNLELLSTSGIERRIQEIERMRDEFGKRSHQEALRSAFSLHQKLLQSGREITTRTFLADAFDSGALARGLSGTSIDLVISDVPYGRLTAWSSSDGNANNQPLQRMLEALLPLLSPQSLVAIAADKSQKVAAPGYRRAARFGIGKREITFLLPSG